MSEDAKITALHEPSKNHMCSEIHEQMFQCLFSSKGKAEYFNDSCHTTNINCIAIRSLINTLSIVQNGFQVHCRGSYFLHESSNKNLNGLFVSKLRTRYKKHAKSYLTKAEDRVLCLSFLIGYKKSYLPINMCNKSLNRTFSRTASLFQVTNQKQPSLTIVKTISRG